ncbi:glutathione S-transferase family protein [Azohydromonas lata]|uniref:Glutathione S-transferase family protein n=1 Tax=Azohydromonas lata TaxID=45677 RepID=A0ABU5INW2_9BURK|nr:glutathione S-transferase family protein [Azohydromonas lata]MDZ5460559.1 glutathione S-transferase family protein [Azohydromonas lata]
MQLYFHPSNASMAPHLLLQDIGAPFELKFVDRDRGEHQSPEYLRLNPNGRIPVLVDGDLVLYEAAAICLYLADKFPDARLAPPAGTPQRARLYQWMFWLSNTLQAMLMHWFYPERMVDSGDAAAASQVRAQAEEHIAVMLQRLDEQVAASGGPWLLGADYGAADAYALMLCRWTRHFDRPARDYPHLGPYLQRLLERPAVQRMFEAEGLQAPLV